MTLKSQETRHPEWDRTQYRVSDCSQTVQHRSAESHDWRLPTSLHFLSWDAYHSGRSFLQLELLPASTFNRRSVQNFGKSVLQCIILPARPGLSLLDVPMPSSLLDVPMPSSHISNTFCVNHQFVSQTSRQHARALKCWQPGQLARQGGQLARQEAN